MTVAAWVADGTGSEGVEVGVGVAVLDGVDGGVAVDEGELVGDVVGDGVTWAEGVAVGGDEGGSLCVAALAAIATTSPIARIETSTRISRRRLLTH